MNCYTFDAALRSSLEEARERIVDKGLGGANPNFLISIVRDACDDDHEHGEIRKPANGSRRQPIILKDKALSFIHDSAIRQADIVLVDSDTFSNPDDIQGEWTNPVSIQAKSFRPYLPYKGSKTDKSHAYHIKQMLNGNKLPNADELVKKIQATHIGSDGMYVKQYPEAFNIWAPKICLIYSLTAQARRVFMLRPSAGNLNNITYRIYCYVVMNTILKRLGGKCDLAFWDELDQESRVYFHKSMWVPDSKLAISEGEIKSFPEKIITDNFPEINSPDILIAA